MKKLIMILAMFALQIAFFNMQSFSQVSTKSAQINDLAYNQPGASGGDLRYVFGDNNSNVIDAAIAATQYVTSCTPSFPVTVFTETVGNLPVGTASQTIAAHISPYGFDNAATLTYSGTALVKTQFPSTGYTGASGMANVYISNNGTVGKYFMMQLINTTGLSNITLSFGVYRTLPAAGPGALVVEYSTNSGGSWTTITPSIASNGSWLWVTCSPTLAAGANTWIRWTNTAINNLGYEYRIDDIKLTGIATAAHITYAGPAAFCPGSQVTLTANSGSAYHWSTGPSSQSIVVSTSGTYSVTVTDAYSCTSSTSVTLADNTYPVITCPSNIRVNATLNQCNAEVTYVTPTGTDNCPNPVTVRLTPGYTASGGTFPVGVTTVIYQVTDASGNSTTCWFTVTVVDNQLPTIVCPANITMSTNTESCGAYVTYSVPAYNDNCPGATIVQTTGLGTGYVFPKGVTTNTWKVTDASGNSATCTFTVTVNDNQPPIINCPSNVTLSLLANCSIIYNYTTPAGHDNCPGVSTVQTSGLASGSSFPIGTTINRFKATDASGNSSTCWFSVTVKDTIPPVISCPSNISTNVDEGICGDILTYNTPVGTDNCPNAVTTRVTGLASGATFPVGCTTVTYMVTDGSGNTAWCSFIVTVRDDILPTITCPANVTGYVDSYCEYEVPGTVADPTFNDNCPGAYIENNWDYENTLDGESFSLGTTTVVWDVWDASDNSAQCSFTVTVLDNIPPTIICPGNQWRDLGYYDCSYTASISEFDALAGDNCELDSLNHMLTGATTGMGMGSLNGTVFNIGVTTVTWVAKDASGNSSTCTFTITINDINPPNLYCPSNICVNIDEGLCTAMVTYCVFATDCPCLPNPTPVLISGAASGSLFPIGCTTITWWVTDLSGNTATCTFTVRVKDNIDPIITCPYSNTYYATTSPNNCTYTHTGTGWDATVWDNCGPLTVWYELYGATSGTGTTLAGVTFELGSTDVIWYVEDASGNSSECSFTVEVDDDTNPYITCPGNKTRVDAQGLCYYTASGTEFDPLSYGDNCSVFGLVYWLSGATEAGPVCATTLNDVDFYNGVTTVTWEVIDGSFNTNYCTFTVTVKDNQLPVISCHSNFTSGIYTNEGSCYYTTDGSIFDPNPVGDNCPGYTVTYMLSNQTTGTGSNTLDGVQFNKGVTTVVWKITDASGNMASCTFTVKVIDNVAPGISCSNKVKVTSNNPYITVGTEFNPTWWDNCNVTSKTFTLSGATVAIGSNSLAGVGLYRGVTTVVWKVADAPGNSATCTFTITIAHTTALAVDDPAVSKSASVDNYPNPFDGKTKLVFTLPEDTHVILDIYDLTGKLIRTLYDAEVSKDQEYTVEFDGSAYPSGIYVYRMKTNEGVITGKMIQSKE